MVLLVINTFYVLNTSLKPFFVENLDFANVNVGIVPNGFIVIIRYNCFVGKKIKHSLLFSYFVDSLNF